MKKLIKKVRFTQEAINHKEKKTIDFKQFTKEQNKKESDLQDILYLIEDTQNKINKLKIKSSRA